MCTTAIQSATAPPRRTAASHRRKRLRRKWCLHHHAARVAAASGALRGEHAARHAAFARNPPAEPRRARALRDILHEHESGGSCVHRAPRTIRNRHGRSKRLGSRRTAVPASPAPHGRVFSSNVRRVVFTTSKLKRTPVHSSAVQHQGPGAGRSPVGERAAARAAKNQKEKQDNTYQARGNNLLTFVPSGSEAGSA